MPARKPRIREITTSGTIEAVMGIQSLGIALRGDQVPHFADTDNERIRRIDLTTATATTQSSKIAFVAAPPAARSRRTISSP